MTTIVTKLEIQSKLNFLGLQLTELKDLVVNSVIDGSAAHEVEKNLYKKVFELGLHTLQGFFNLQGNGDMGETTREQSLKVEQYRETKPEPVTEEEGEILVVTEDGKGVPIKQPLGSEIKIEDHQFKKGPKLGRKRMAVVGAIYSIDRYIREPEEIMEALFKNNASNGVS
jgi:hypothetical protein